MRLVNADLEVHLQIFVAWALKEWISGKTHLHNLAAASVGRVDVFCYRLRA
jgi:hypothetical protein